MPSLCDENAPLAVLEDWRRVGRSSSAAWAACQNWLRPAAGSCAIRAMPRVSRSGSSSSSATPSSVAASRIEHGASPPPSCGRNVIWTDSSPSITRSTARKSGRTALEDPRDHRDRGPAGLRRPMRDAASAMGHGPSREQRYLLKSALGRFPRSWQHARRRIVILCPHSVHPTNAFASATPRPIRPAYALAQGTL